MHTHLARYLHMSFSELERMPMAKKFAILSYLNDIIAAENTPPTPSST